MTMQWSDAKQQLFRFETDIAVSAGAGSGKTAALVELYLRLLAGETSLGEPLAVDRIVAITFTDKAAAEMKDRVRRGVGERLKLTGARVWKERQRELAAAGISTFHAFCARILRENPAEAGVDPAFSLLDELEAGAELEAALDEVIEAELTARTPSIRLLLGNFPLSGHGHGKGLREYVKDLLRREGSNVAVDRQGIAWQAEAEELFIAGCRELAELAGESKRILGMKELAFHRALAPLPGLYGEGPLDLADTETGRRLQAMADCIAGNWGKEKPVRDRLSECLAQLQLAYWQVRSAPVAEALLGLTRQVAVAYGRRKGRRGALDFDDLQIKCRDLLARDSVIRDDYRQRCRVLMVDEFQDTNPLQKELVGLLCGPGQRLFVVGDPKQSIYLFRGADVGVFLQTSREIRATGGQNLYFQESFRSREGIIRFVNSLFGQVMGGSGADFDPSYGDGDIMEPSRRDWDGTPCVELLAGSCEGDADARRRREAAAIARRIQEIVNGSAGINAYDKDRTRGDFTPRPPRYGDIAILFRRFSNLKLFERELRRAGIPYYVVKGRGFYRCQEVRDILNFLTFLEYGGDLAALAGVLRSPLCGISDETLYWLARAEGGLATWQQGITQNSKLKTQNSYSDRIAPADQERLASLANLVGRLRPLRDRLTLAELLEEILTGSDFASTLLTTFQGEQKVANLRKLIELARSFTRPGEISLRRFINYLTDLVEREPTEAEAAIAAEGEDVVRLMTIHQSKGLEFPLVFVPELGAGQPGNHPAVQHDPDLGLGIKLSLPGGIPCPTLAYRAIADRRKAKEAAELKRLFYVAVTRARDHLILSGEGRGEWRGWLDAFLAGPEGSLVTTVDAEEMLTGKAVPPVPAIVEVETLSRELLALAADRALHYAPPPPSAMVFSPTALEDYALCPRKYYYKGVLGLDEGLFARLLAPHRTSRQNKREGMSPLEQGNLAHAILERLDFGAGADDQRRQCRQLVASMAVAGGEAEEVVEQVLALVSSPLGKELATARLLREHPFTLHLKGAADYYIRGAMDLVAVRDDLVTVYDYKYMTRNGADLEGYRFQLSTYMVALGRAFPGRRVEAQLVFLKDGGSESVECDLASFEAHLRGLMDAIRERSGERDFALMAGCDGSHCPFRQRCDVAGLGARG
ncbi:exodeoxyribonuclease V subunit beta [Geobacter sp. AOG1]|uniref:UvrD-helicase domain-containing protein n=1 Tax=Geobacter sp. AOG1 TaxID=1566346 RepID=UPI001CC6A47E|nr:UvrD-helicase domain-containing protein [Geobacter sp. AOG1]GFE56491.1 hypothetical protein AOG1_03700 [Geobacter sp. AOG1]